MITLLQKEYLFFTMAIITKYIDIQTIWWLIGFFLISQKNMNIILFAESAEKLTIKKFKNSLKGIGYYNRCQSPREFCEFNLDNGSHNWHSTTCSWKVIWFLFTNICQSLSTILIVLALILIQYYLISDLFRTIFLICDLKSIQNKSLK